MKTWHFPQQWNDAGIMQRFLKKLGEFPQKTRKRCKTKKMIKTPGFAFCE